MRSFPGVPDLDFRDHTEDGCGERVVLLNAKLPGLSPAPTNHHALVAGVQGNRVADRVQVPVLELSQVIERQAHLEPARLIHPRRQRRYVFALALDRRLTRVEVKGLELSRVRQA